MKTGVKKRRTGGRKKRPELARLIREERALSKRLEKLQVRISKLDGPKMSSKKFDQLLDELAGGPVSSKTLPPDFSRADIYDDHD